MNLSHRIIIVDDEPPARDIIEVFVERTPDLVCVATCANAMQALEAINQFKPDLLFLDIQMPEMTGIDLMNLRLANRPDIILTTAYPDFALKSYEFAVLDYLVKPIAFDRFVQAIIKFREKRSQFPPTSPGGWSAVSTPPLGTDQPLDDTMPNSPPNVSSVWLREEKRLLQIPFEEIFYVEGLKDYVKVHLNGKMILTHLSIGKAEELFQPPTFVRIHRSHIVRQSAIRLIDGNTVVLTNDVKLLIGPLYREELKRYISALR